MYEKNSHCLQSICFRWKDSGEKDKHLKAARALQLADDLKSTSTQIRFPLKVHFLSSVDDNEINISQTEASNNVD